jgi:hypothetical protein
MRGQHLIRHLWQGESGQGATELDGHIGIDCLGNHHIDGPNYLGNQGRENSGSRKTGCQLALPNKSEERCRCLPAAKREITAGE